MRFKFIKIDQEVGILLELFNVQNPIAVASSVLIQASPFARPYVF